MDRVRSSVVRSGAEAAFVATRSARRSAAQEEAGGHTRTALLLGDVCEGEARRYCLKEISERTWLQYHGGRASREESARPCHRCGR